MLSALQKRRSSSIRRTTRYQVAGGVRRAIDQGNGLVRFSVNDALNPMITSKQQLFEPLTSPDGTWARAGSRGGCSGA
jgi:hypothetical protein